MKNILYISLIILCGCSANYHAQKARRHELIAISKGAKISHDTIYKKIYIKVAVPGDSGSVGINPTLDTGQFAGDINKNDSLVNYINSLKVSIGEWDTALGEATLDKEKAFALLVKANKELSVLRSRLIRGYSKDSTYVFKPDSVTDIEVEVKAGLVNKLNYKRKDTTLQSQQVVPIEVRRIFELGYKHWQVYTAVAGVGLILLVIGIIVGRLTKPSG